MDKVIAKCAQLDAREQWEQSQYLLELSQTATHPMFVDSYRTLSKERQEASKELYHESRFFMEIEE